MTTYIEPTFVILGLNTNDAQGAYRELVEKEPERIFGCRVRIVTPHGSGAAFDGMRVHDYHVTERASLHKNYDKALSVLKRNALKTGVK